MKKILTPVAVLLAATGMAQDTVQNKNKGQINISEYVEAYYSYDFNKPKAAPNSLIQVITIIGCSALWH